MNRRQKRWIYWQILRQLDLRKQKLTTTTIDQPHEPDRARSTALIAAAVSALSAAMVGRRSSAVHPPGARAGTPAKPWCGGLPRKHARQPQHDTRIEGDEDRESDQDEQVWQCDLGDIAEALLGQPLYH